MNVEHDQRSPLLSVGPAVIPADTSAPSRARELVRPLIELGDEQLLEDAALLVSELVANVVRHTDSPFATVAMTVDEAAVRVEVGDTSASTAPKVVDTPPEEPGGLGLQIVRMLSDDWGTETQPDGKVVWFELPCSRVAQQPSAGHGMARRMIGG